MRKKGYSLRDIGKVLNRSISTLSDELKRNQVNDEYNPKKAHHKAYVRKRESKYQGMTIVSNNKLRKFIEEKLYDDQSPVNISERILKHEKHITDISKDSIYRYIESVYGRQIEHYRETRKKRPRRKRRPQKEKLKDRTFINERPDFINKRMRIGDAESDFIVSGRSGKGMLLVLVDRKSRIPFIEKITKVNIPNVHKAFIKIKSRFPELKTITTDNDILLQKHKELAEVLKVKIYFCNPYHSWEKGLVDNVNGHIRKDIPKGSNISKYTKKFIQKVEDKLQRKIMKCLNYLTPDEVLKNYRKKQKTPHCGE